MGNEVASSFLTLAGCRFQQGPYHPPDRRAAAAAAAGFDGMGVSDADLPWEPHPTACPVTEIEWLNLSDPDWLKLERLWHIADTLGTVRRIHAGSTTERTGAEPEALRKLADLAGERGIKVAVEPVVFGGIPRYCHVLDLIDGIGRPPGVGLLYDTFQVYRNERKLPFVQPNLITSIQVAGTPVREFRDPFQACMNRELPQSGKDAADVESFIDTMLAAGYDGPVAAEIPHARYRNRRLACTVVAPVVHGAVMDLFTDSVEE